MKILIWDKDYTLKNVGGPTGYMHNLHEYLKNNKDNEIAFYSDLMNGNNDEKKINKSIFRKAFSGLIKRFRFLDLLASLKVYYAHKNLDSKDLSLLERYDYVHLHSMFQFSTYFSYDKRTTKVILTIHYPEPPIDETFSSYGYKWILDIFPFLRNYFIKKEICILKKADYMMFPVKEAIEAYTSSSKLYKLFFQQSKDTFFYVPSALFPSEKLNVEGSFSLSKYGVKKESLKLCFIGRHNVIKGYDRLKVLAKEIWRIFPDVYFIIGGTEAPLKRLNDPRWIELGWVNTNEVLEQVDAFILPNKQTYFDLVLLEVLRQGKVCIISDTGGNKWFSQFNNRGILLYENETPDSIVPIIRQILKYKKDSELTRVEDENRMFFKEHFTCEKYFSQYKEEISKLNLK